MDIILSFALLMYFSPFVEQLFDPDDDDRSDYQKWEDNQI